jgi:PhnB protein
MNTINSYMTFNGNCREAMTFYQQCLGGELIFQTIGESPLSEKMPKKMKDFILHSTLSKDSLLLMGSDMVPETGLIRGNSVSLLLTSDSEKELKSWYKKLSAGGQLTHPLQQNFWGALFGSLTDKFGNNWLFNCPKGQTDNSNTNQNERRIANQDAD